MSSCEPKLRFTTRTAAKRHLRRSEGSGGLRRDGNRVYRCLDCGLFHFGHLPANVIHGLVSRGEVYERSVA